MERIRRRISYANVAATMALVLAVSGGAYAATGGFSSGGTLHACVNEEGVIRLIKPGKKCKRGQTAVSWNQTGPAGAPGATGAMGAAGAPGTPGAKGAAGTGPPSLWALIGPEGELVDGSEVAHVEGKDPVTVTFDRNVEHCAITGGLGSSPATEIFERPLTQGKAFVVTTNDKGELVGSFFYVVATC